MNHHASWTFPSATATSSGNTQDLFAPRDSDLFTPTSIGVGVFDFSFCWNRHARNMVREQLFNIMICQRFAEMEGGLYSKGVQNWMFQDLQSCSLVDQFASLACGHNTCYFIKHVVFILLFCSCTSWVTLSREWDWLIFHRLRVGASMQAVYLFGSRPPIVAKTAVHDVTYGLQSSQSEAPKGQFQPCSSCWLLHLTLKMNMVCQKTAPEKMRCHMLPTSS